MHSVYAIHEHFGPVFNEVMATQVINQRFLSNKKGAVLSSTAPFVFVNVVPEVTAVVTAGPSGCCHLDTTYNAEC